MLCPFWTVSESMLLPEKLGLKRDTGRGLRPEPPQRCELSSSVLRPHAGLAEGRGPGRPALTLTGGKKKYGRQLPQGGGRP